MDKKFTVITTTYNDGKDIKNYLDSINSQTLIPSEIIIVDGGSTDNTTEIIEKYSESSKVHIKLFKGTRLNIAQGFNKGIQSCQTQYLIITCTGNKFAKTMCQDLYNKIIEDKADAAYGLLDGIASTNFSKLYNEAFISKEGNNIMSNRCVMYNKKAFEKIGYFKENFIYAGEDAEFLYRFDNMKLKRDLVKKKLVSWETPKNWKQYIKQRKNYAIGDLQYLGISKCLLRKDELQYYLILILMFMGSLHIIFPIIALFIFLRRLYCGRNISYIKVKLLRETSTLLKILFSLRYIKYSTKRYKV